MKKVLIEGWRGICQSLAMVNQYQVHELLKLQPNLSLSHRDLPFFSQRWAEPGNETGFPLAMTRSIMDIPAPVAEEYDTVYRIGYPFARSRTPAKRVITYIITEFGLSPEAFAPGDAAADKFCSGDDLVVTPSNWSKVRLIDYGFPSGKIHVIPHGVNGDFFFPLSKQERQVFRTDLGVSDENFVFLNLGSLTLNKGVHVLIEAFKRIRQYYENARLVLKDSSPLYGTTALEFIEDHVKLNGPLPAEVVDSIYLVPPSLSLGEMRLLYGGVDMYVSPYHAEGFNLPVIEAIACGTPAIVTDGGPTDDFCDTTTSLKIRSDLIPNKDRDFSVPGYHLDPHMDSLLEQMQRAISGAMPSGDTFEYGRCQLVERFSWAAGARQLAELF